MPMKMTMVMSRTVAVEKKVAAERTTTWKKRLS